jgi:hypothetical protein
LADALVGHIALELSEGQQHVERRLQHIAVAELPTLLDTGQSAPQRQ